MTAAEMTLPGAIPGLLRRGSPVPHPRATDIPCTVVACHTNDRTCVVGYPWPVNGEWADTWPLDALSLDLRCDTGRTHAAWWLAVRRPLRGHSNLDLHNALGLWEVDRWTDDDRRVFWDALAEDDCFDALADLDPDDPRLLPDGSRLVDALALRRVVLHVAGVTRG